jgi:tRNA dimethylallyltransferase
MPSADPATREALTKQIQDEGLASLYRELQAIDPTTAQRLAPGDSQRIQRAMEVYRVSGRTLSSFHRDKPPPPMPPLLSLEPTDRAWLHERIAQRLQLMMEGGLIDEVRGLMQRGDLNPDLPSMRCVGYRQTWEALETGQATELADRCLAATRQLAKRQITWLRSMPARQVLSCDEPSALTQAVAWAREQAKALPLYPL